MKRSLLTCCNFILILLVAITTASALSQEEIWSKYSTALGQMLEPQFRTFLSQSPEDSSSNFGFQVLTAPWEIASTSQPGLNNELSSTTCKFVAKPFIAQFEPMTRKSVYDQYRDAILSLGQAGMQGFIKYQRGISDNSNLFMEEKTTLPQNFGNLASFHANSLSKPNYEDNIYINQTSVYRSNMLLGSYMTSQNGFVSKYTAGGNNVVQKSGIGLFSSNFLMRFSSKGIIGLVVKPGSWFDREILKTYKNDLKQKGFFSNSGTSADQDRDLTSIPRIIWLAVKPKVELRLTEKELNDMKNEWGSALGISIGNILFKNAANVQNYQIKMMNDVDNQINQRIIEKAIKKATKLYNLRKIELESDQKEIKIEENEKIPEFQLRDIMNFMNTLKNVEEREENQESSDSQVTSNSNDGVSISYNTLVAGQWQPKVGSGQKSGTEGRSLAMQQISISLGGAVPAGSHIVYQVHVSGVGWTNWFSDGQVAGVAGRQIESIRIKLSGPIQESYELEYNVHASGVGWMGFTRENTEAGTTGQSRRLECIIINLKQKIPIGELKDWVKLQYSTHSEGIGWGPFNDVGFVSGTVGQSKRMEAIRIRLIDAPAFCHVNYRVHVAGIGWMPYVRDGEVSGTTGQSRRAEAIQINLENMPGYQVKYRAHVSGIGWMPWVLDGEVAGTTGQSRQMEAVEILVMKNMITASFESNSDYPQVIGVSSIQLP